MKVYTYISGGTLLILTADQRALVLLIESAKCKRQENEFVEIIFPKSKKLYSNCYLLNIISEGCNLPSAPNSMTVDGIIRRDRMSVVFK